VFFSECSETELESFLYHNLFYLSHKVGLWIQGVRAHHANSKFPFRHILHRSITGISPTLKLTIHNLNLKRKVQQTKEKTQTVNLSLIIRSCGSLPRLSLLLTLILPKPNMSRFLRMCPSALLAFEALAALLCWYGQAID